MTPVNERDFAADCDRLSSLLPCRLCASLGLALQRIAGP